MKIGELTVSRATVCLPRTGLWWVEVALADGSQNLVLGSKVTLDGTTAFVGRVVEVAPAWGRIVGANGLRSTLKPQFLREGSRGFSLGLAAGELVRSVGETVDPTSDPLPERLGSFSRPAMPAGQVLHRLLERHGQIYRVLPSGLVWMGTPKPKPLPDGTEYVVMSTSTSGARIAFETYVPKPGDVVEGKTITSVYGTISRGATRYDCGW